MIDEMIGKVLSTFFEVCRNNDFAREIAILQGHRVDHDCTVIHCLKIADNQNEILNTITSLTENSAFRQYILDQTRKEKEEEIKECVRKQLAADSEVEYQIYDNQIKTKKEYLDILDWEWFVENNCSTFCCIPDIKDWRWVLLHYLYGYYIKDVYGRFLNYTKGCPLDTFLYQKGVNVPHFEDNYGLLSIDDSWVIKSGLPSKVYIPSINTHVILRHIPSDLLSLINNWRDVNRFDLSLRPDYYICGDTILDKQLLCEEKDFGKSYSGKLDTIDVLSKYYDRDWVNDWLLVSHSGQDITFEEILEDGPHDQENFVTQIVHMQYGIDNNQEFISHIDHEYAFYSVPGLELKRNKLLAKGEARTRYKTFKIDNARIPFVNDSSNNILYKVLTCYFTKGDLVDEFFKGERQ